MNASGEFLASGASPTLFGLRICDLGWNATLGLVEGIVSLRGNRTTLAFLDERAALHQAVDIDYRDQLDRRLLLPGGSRILGLFSRILRGRATPVRFAPGSFVPALLTYLERGCRIGIAGEDAGRLDALREHFARHAPWHEVIAILPQHEIPHRLDVVIVDAPTFAAERRIERRLASVRTGLVIMAGAGLSGLVASRPASATSHSAPVSNPSFA